MPQPQAFHSTLVRTLLGLMLCCMAMLAACKRQDPENQSGDMVLTASATEVYAGLATPVKLTVSGQLPSDTISWSLAGPGSLSATTGSSVQYTPPASIPNEDSAMISASRNGGSPAQVTIKLHPAAPLALLAGNLGGAGNLDSKLATAARFYGPSAVVLDSAGNSYMADTANHTIRKISPTGEVSTLAGAAGKPGSVDGSGATARFYEPQGLALDSSGNLYVADSGNHTIRMVSATGVVSTVAGLAGSAGAVDGSGAEARFFRPTGLVVDGAANLYVSDSANHALRLINSGGLVRTLAGQAGARGSNDGFGTAARFDTPQGLALGKDGNLYVADANHLVRKITPAGQVDTLAGTAGAPGNADGTGTAARFYDPRGLSADANGNIYVADTFNATIRKINPAGVVSTLAGAAGQSGSADGLTNGARFHLPLGLANDAAGNVYVADSGNNTLRRITPQGLVDTVAGTAGVRGSIDAVGAAAQFNGQHGLASDAAGNVYVADTANSTIRKISSTGVVTTLAGTAGVNGSADGMAGEARFYASQSVAIDGSGNLYVADTANSTVRKISPNGQVSTFAGVAGQSGHVDGVGDEARFYLPQGVTTDPAGNVYISDTLLDKNTPRYSAVIRKITPVGRVTTMAGSGVLGGADGLGATASFNEPRGLASDEAGNIYVADSANATIRRITPAGIVSTLAGSAGNSGSRNGIGALAQFNNPTGLTVGADGFIYVADTGNHLIRKVGLDGTVTTVAGDQLQLQRGISLGSLPGGLDSPVDIRHLGGNRFAVSSGNAILTLTLP
ncbi:hypothetical protein FNU76_11455 [Chitinimonas arctica]|uniref:Teneurin NHL domain-containing protein n=1 Tax=Chitinimonas arctica TaxID=2594795 RepID=A0A516SFX7_9NEIS|nr:NHL repeat-containing protein [Chitinimonas arctica]QDQ26928.1 hypothetical protein FNU76_11455 [Chitinimonas arctica]